MSGNITIRPLTAFQLDWPAGQSEVVFAAAGAVPGLIQVAAASPTFGRLFEGTYAPSPGQTSPTRQPLQGILPAKLLTIRTPETATLTKNPPQRKTTVGSRTENC